MADLDGANALLQEGQTATRGRPRRIEAETRQRRKRVGDVEDTSALAVPQEVRDKLASQGLEGRWINDIGNRMYQKTVTDDWDKVDGIDPVPVGTDSRTGERVMAHFCAKPKDFLAEDNGRRMKGWNERENQSLAGHDPSAPIEGEYQPLGSKNVIRRS